MKDNGRATARAGMKQAVVAAVRAAVDQYVYRTGWRRRATAKSLRRPPTRRRM
jgi:hypothetical protein